MAKQLFLCLIAVFISSPTVFGWQVRGSGNNGKAAEPLPYTMEIDEESGEQGVEVTLAVGAVTIFRCPEPPLQIIFGNQEGLDLAETTPGRTEIYIRPTKGNLFTNMIIEMKSGPVVLYLKTIAPKGAAKVGDYHGDITIKNKAYSDILTQAKAEAFTAQAEMERAQAELTQAQDRIKELEAVAATKSKVADEGFYQEILKAFEGTPQASKQIISETAGVRISKLGSATRTAQGWLVMLVVENRSKEEKIITGINTDNGKVYSTISGARRLAPRLESRIALLITEPSEGEQLASNLSSIGPITATPQLTLLISGTAINVKF